MCEPITISTGVAWALAATTVATGLYAADAQRKAGEANAKIEENNAALARGQAADAQAMGDRESEQQAWRTRALIGQQRAAIASSGVDADIGTPAEILGETAMFGEVDQQTIRLNAARNAWGFNAQAQNALNRGQQAKWQGKTQANTTILGSLSSAAGTVAGAY